MSKAPRILNLTRGFHLKRSQAERAIENCAAVWVEEGKTIRDVTLAEAIALRNRQTKAREPLAFSEIHGLRFQPPATDTLDPQAKRELIQSANWFAQPKVSDFAKDAA